MCFSCLKPKTVCKWRKCSNIGSVPEVLKCAVGALWAESKKRVVYIQYFFFKQKQLGDSRAQMSDLRKELEKYIRKLRSTVVDSKIQFSVNYMFKSIKKKKKKMRKTKSTHDEVSLVPVPTFDSETGEILMQVINLNDPYWFFVDRLGSGRFLSSPQYDKAFLIRSPAAFTPLPGKYTLSLTSITPSFIHGPH